MTEYVIGVVLGFAATVLIAAWWDDRKRRRARRAAMLRFIRSETRERWHRVEPITEEDESERSRR